MTIFDSSFALRRRSLNLSMIKFNSLSLGTSTRLNNNINIVSTRTRLLHDTSKSSKGNMVVNLNTNRGLTSKLSGVNLISVLKLKNRINFDPKGEELSSFNLIKKIITYRNTGPLGPLVNKKHKTRTSLAGKNRLSTKVIKKVIVSLSHPSRHTNKGLISANAYLSHNKTEKDVALDSLGKNLNSSGLETKSVSLINKRKLLPLLLDMSPRISHPLALAHNKTLTSGLGFRKNIGNPNVRLGSLKGGLITKILKSLNRDALVFLSQPQGTTYSYEEPTSLKGLNKLKKKVLTRLTKKIDTFTLYRRFLNEIIERRLKEAASLYNSKKYFKSEQKKKDQVKVYFKGMLAAYGCYFENREIEEETAKQYYNQLRRLSRRMNNKKWLDLWKKKNRISALREEYKMDNKDKILLNIIKERKLNLISKISPKFKEDLFKNNIIQFKFQASSLVGKVSVGPSSNLSIDPNVITNVSTNVTSTISELPSIKKGYELVNISDNTDFDSFYKLLKSFFKKNLRSIISLPIIESLPEKLNIRLFYFIKGNRQINNKIRHYKKFIKRSGNLYREIRLRAYFSNKISKQNLTVFLSNWKILNGSPIGLSPKGSIYDNDYTPLNLSSTFFLTNLKDSSNLNTYSPNSKISQVKKGKLPVFSINKTNKIERLDPQSSDLLPSLTEFKLPNLVLNSLAILVFQKFGDSLAIALRQTGAAFPFINNLALNSVRDLGIEKNRIKNGSPNGSPNGSKNGSPNGSRVGFNVMNADQSLISHNTTFFKPSITVETKPRDKGFIGKDEALLSKSADSIYNNRSILPMKNLSILIPRSNQINHNNYPLVSDLDLKKTILFLSELNSILLKTKIANSLVIPNTSDASDFYNKLNNEEIQKILIDEANFVSPFFSLFYSPPKKNKLVSNPVDNGFNKDTLDHLAPIELSPHFNTPRYYIGVEEIGGTGVENNDKLTKTGASKSLTVLGFENIKFKTLSQFIYKHLIVLIYRSITPLTSNLDINKLRNMVQESNILPSIGEISNDLLYSVMPSLQINRSIPLFNPRFKDFTKTIEKGSDTLSNIIKEKLTELSSFPLINNENKDPSSNPLAADSNDTDNSLNIGPQSPQMLNILNLISHSDYNYKYHLINMIYSINALYRAQLRNNITLTYLNKLSDFSTVPLLDKKLAKKAYSESDRLSVPQMVQREGVRDFLHLTILTKYCRNYLYTFFRVPEKYTVWVRRKRFDSPIYKTKFVKKSYLTQQTTISLKQKKMKIFIRYLETLFNKAIELDLTRLKYPYHDSQILSQVIGHSSQSRFAKFFRMMKTLDYTASITRPGSFITNNSKLKRLPSVLSGIKVKLAGRLLRGGVVPRYTEKNFQTGSFARSKFGFKNTSRITLKNKRGAYSFTVTISHLFEHFNSPITPRTNSLNMKQIASSLPIKEVRSSLKPLTLKGSLDSIVNSRVRSQTKLN